MSAPLVAMARAILGWLAANVVGLVAFALLLMLVAWATAKPGASFGESAFAFTILFMPTAIVSGPILLVTVLIIRATGVRRPWADVVGGAAVAMATVTVPQLLLFPSHLMTENALLGFALFCGPLAGVTYWYVAGKPRPPYD